MDTPPELESSLRRTPRPAPTAHVATFRLDAELVVYEPSTAQAHVLNVTAARIWELCDGRRTLDDVARHVAAAYVIDPAEAHADVADLVARLEAAGLLTLV